MTLSPPAAELLARTTLRKVTWRLVPFLFLLYVVNLIDRTNVGIAKLQMVDREPALFDAQTFGSLVGIFYIGYLLFEVPSNLILARVGARTWIARIAITWGIISACMMFVTGPWSFAMLRFLLGFAEAGFFPGIIYYLSHWFPARVRGRTVARFMSGGVLATLVGNALSGAILRYMDGTAGLAGWQWVFLLEGIPAVVLGVITFRFLTDRPQDASWLKAEERAWLVNELEREAVAVAQHNRHSLWVAFTEPRVWLLIALYFTVAVGDNVYGFYVPSFLKQRFPDWTTDHIGYLGMVPSVVALVVMNLVGWHSDKRNERRWHIALAALTASGGWLILASEPSPWLFVGGLTLVTAGMKSMLPVFWTLPASFLSGVAAVSGVAFINSVANLGGWLGPKAIGQLTAQDPSFGTGYLLMAALLFAGSILALCVQVRQPATLPWPTGEGKS